MHKIAIINAKGGCGRTTSCFNIATAMALVGKKVLIVDCDPQGTITDFCDIDKESNTFDKNSLSRIFVPYKRYIKTADCIYSVKTFDEKVSQKYPKAIGKLFILPTNRRLMTMELDVLVNGKSRETLLKRILKEVENDYDYCFIDCPPNSGVLAINAIVASDGVIFPTEAEKSSLEGINQILTEIDALIEAEIIDKKSFTIYGVVVTRAQQQTNYQQLVIDNIKKHFDILGIVGEAIDVQKFQSQYHSAVVLGNPKCEAAKEYKAIANSICKATKKYKVIANNLEVSSDKNKTKDTEVRARVTLEERELFKKYCATHKNSEGEPMTMSQMLRAIVRDCGRKYLEETEGEED